MTSGRKISFLEPDMAALRANAALESGTPSARPGRCPSPYPYNVPKDDEDDENDSHGTNSDDMTDQGDESLQRYKESLGLATNDLSDPNDPRVCIIQSLTMESPGRPPVVIDLSAPGSVETLKKNPFKIKEGASFTMSAQFKVQHEILSGLHYVQAVKRKGIRVAKSSEMIVSYSRHDPSEETKRKRSIVY